MNENKLASFRRSNVGIIFQSFHLIPTMTALENVAVPLELNGNKDAFGLAEEALVKVGLLLLMLLLPDQRHLYCRLILKELQHFRGQSLLE